jgi:hypothetical protein
MCYRLILLFCLLMQFALLMYSNHVRAGMLKTMREQNGVMEQQDAALKKASQAMDAQSVTIGGQDGALKQAARAIAIQKRTIESRDAAIRLLLWDRVGLIGFIETQGGTIKQLRSECGVGDWVAHR